MAQPFMMTSPQPPQQASAPVQMTSSFGQPEKRYIELYEEAPYVPMPRSALRYLPHHVHRGTEQDVAHMPYTCTMRTITVIFAVMACGVLVIGIVDGSSMDLPALLTFALVAAITAFCAFVARSFTVEFDKPSQTMHITKRRLLLHCCPTRLDLPFATPVRVSLCLTGIRVGLHVHETKIMALRLCMDGHEIEMQRGGLAELVPNEKLWLDYLKSIGVHVIQSRTHQDTAHEGAVLLM